MNQEVLQHIESSVDEIRALFTKAATSIESIKPGEKIPATVLAETLAKEIGKTGPQVYPVLKYLFDNYPGVEIKRGAHGGIQRIKPPTVIAAVTPVVVTENEEADVK